MNLIIYFLLKKERMYFYPIYKKKILITLFLIIILTIPIVIISPYFFKSYLFAILNIIIYINLLLIILLLITFIRLRDHYFSLKDVLEMKYKNNGNISLSDFNYLKEKLAENGIILNDDLSIKSILNQIDKIIEKNKNIKVIF